MKKVLKNPLFTFILGAIIFGSISTVFAYSKTSNAVSYTPTDSSFIVDNVSDAIDYLRTNSTDYVYGTITSSRYSIWETIELGFKPRMIIGIGPTSGGFLRSFVYIEDRGNTAYSRGSRLYTDSANTSVQTYGTGFKWYVFDSSWKSQTLYYYAFK